MRLSILSVDYAPEELHEQTPFSIKLLRQVPGPDRPDYWLGELEQPLKWLYDNHFQEITHVVVAARWVGTQIEPHASNLPIGLAYVLDRSQLDAASLDFAKCKYVAIGLATEVEGGGKPEPPTHVIAGHIARAFGTGSSS